jgi:hypothetical protein
VTSGKHIPEKEIIFDKRGFYRRSTVLDSDRCQYSGTGLVVQYDGQHTPTHHKTRIRPRNSRSRVIGFPDSSGGSGKASFKEAVLVEFPHAGMKALAFITHQVVDNSGEKIFSVYVAGLRIRHPVFLMLVRENQITRPAIGVDAAMKMIFLADWLVRKIVPGSI